ncbi:sugar kinase [Brevundimonas basaltis]|uniref:2-dehydro-3-deoxygluconokinase n=1 Tax=Brevundimonas basaltis TaxID=472166 RepID=A0A7W8HY71_9CAUL|nr:sugar kinase [Brevundimonas basaltis]MBB5292083.1 2-dehydro-3-deoxygluconokinase [Brevundimonas basaltis]
MSDRPRVVSFGECMLELSRQADGSARLAFGGDTLNTALYMARLGADVAYATALGPDPWSDELRAAWSAEGIDLDLALTDPDRVPGLYAIRTDDAGERTFTYWRETSAARNFFALRDSARAAEAMKRADLFYLSGITLSLFDDAGRATIHAIARAVRARGGKVAFDPNYRPRNWPSHSAAREAVAAFLPLVDWALPTFEDEQALMGDATPADTDARWRAAGASLVIVKQGPDGALASDGGPARLVETAPIQPVDTTGAGDSFNAACLHALMSGADLVAAVEAGHRLARQVIQHRGAIIPVDRMPR